MSAASGSSDEGDREVIGSVDGEGSTREYVIADITEEGAWLSMDAEDAPTLHGWR